MPLQDQEHETGHNPRLQLTVERIVTRTCDALKRLWRCIQICKSVQAPLWGISPRSGEPDRVAQSRRIQSCAGPQQLSKTGLGNVAIWS